MNFSAVAPRASAPASVQFDKAPPIAKLGGRGAWSGDELVKNPFWGRELSRAELDELDGALARAMGSGALEFDADDPSVPLNIDREAFALPAGGALARTLGALAEELEHGSGACMLANFPVDRYDEREAAVAYAGVCAHVGQWVPQSSAGLRSKSRGFGMPLGKIRAEMRGATPKDGKQSNNYFRLHTDRCDVISLLGVRVAAAGGHSRVASAVTIHDAMLERAPELVPLMYAPIERLWEGGRGIVKLPIWARHPDTGAFTTQLSPSYIENAQLVSGTRPLTDDEIEVRIAREDAARARVRAGVSETRAPRARARRRSTSSRRSGSSTRTSSCRGRATSRSSTTTSSTTAARRGSTRATSRTRTTAGCCCGAGSRRTTRASCPTRPSSTRCGARSRPASRAAGSSPRSRRGSRPSRPSWSRRSTRARWTTTVFTSASSRARTSISDDPPPLARALLSQKASK